LHKIADAIEARADEIAYVECIDTGQPIATCRSSTARGENFRFYADRAPARMTAVAADRHAPELHYPPAIAPWASLRLGIPPFMLSTWKIAPALAAGCTVVHKREWSPLTATLLSEICLNAGLPPGVLNTVHGFGEDAGRALTSIPNQGGRLRRRERDRQRHHGAGRADLEARALRARRQEPGVVFADADLDRALVPCCS